MGCDIHTFVEVRDAAGKWHLMSLPYKERSRAYPPHYKGFTSDRDLYKYEGRHYAMFSYLAGVRSEGEYTLKEPCGLPAGRYYPPGVCYTNNTEDVSEEVKSKYAEEDDHTPSYYTLAELDAEIDTIEDSFPPLATLLSRMRALSENPSDVRLVFWFDN